MQKKVDRKFQKLLQNLDNLRNSLKIICQNNADFCSKIFDQLDSFQEFRPKDSSKLMTEAKKIAMETSRRVSDIAIKEL